MTNKIYKNGAIILTSGGLDSYVLGHYIKKKLRINNIKLLFFNYEQKALKQELFCVKKLAKQLGAKLDIINLNWLGSISTSLINKNKKTGKEEIIKWYVPCRNSIFILSALAHAESLFLRKKEKNNIYIGVKYEGELCFKDTKPEFIKKINELAKNCVQKGNYKIIAPFINKDKEDIINTAKKLKLDLRKTYSCYIGEKKGKLIHCGKCAGCIARKKGFRFSNVEDSTIYKK